MKHQSLLYLAFPVVLILSSCETATGLSKMPFQLAGGLVPKGLVCQPSREDFTYIKTCQSLLNDNTNYTNFINTGTRIGNENFSLEGCAKKIKGDIGTYGETDPIYSCGTGLLTDEAYYFVVNDKYRKEWINYNQLAVKRISELSINAPDTSGFSELAQYNALISDLKKTVSGLHSYDTFLSNGQAKKFNQGNIDLSSLDAAINKIQKYSYFDPDVVVKNILKNKKIGQDNKTQYATLKITLLKALGTNIDKYIDIIPLKKPELRTEVVAETSVTSQLVTNFSKKPNPEYAYAKAELEYAEKNFLGDAIRTTTTATTQLSNENYLGYAQTMLSDDNAGRRLDNLRSRMREIPEYTYQKNTKPYSYKTKTVRVKKTHTYQVTLNLKEEGIRVSSHQNFSETKDFIIKEGFSCKDISLLKDNGLDDCPTYDITAAINTFSSSSLPATATQNLLTSAINNGTFH